MSVRVVLEGGPAEWDGHETIIHGGPTLERSCRSDDPGQWALALYEATDEKRDVNVYVKRRNGITVERKSAQVFRFVSYRYVSRKDTRLVAPDEPTQMSLV